MRISWNKFFCRIAATGMGLFTFGLALSARAARATNGMGPGVINAKCPSCGVSLRTNMLGGPG